jgi:hypothetical protein
MKKLLIALFSIYALFLGGCLKDTPSVDFSNITAQAELMYPGGANHNGLGTGLEFFGGGAFTFPPTDVSDTVFFIANIAAPNPPNKATAVTVGVDPSIITKYNADTNNAVKYEPMPDSVFTLLNKTVNIPAGKYLDTFWMVVYPSKIDPTKNYMAPVTITDASGNSISANFSTIYFHTIGNPIAGAYSWDYTRYNNQTGTPPAQGSSFIGGSTTFLPDNPTQVEVASGYYIGPRYVITFDNNGGVLSNFAVAFNPTDVATMAGGGVTVTQAPVIITADPVNGIYQFQYVAYNGSAYRYIVDKYYK